MSSLYKAVQHLAEQSGYGSLDGHKDHVGFNSCDSRFGCSLASVPWDCWSIEQKKSAYKLILKYRTQLSSVGIDLDDIKDPKYDQANQREVQRSVDMNDDMFFLVSLSRDAVDIREDLKRVFSGRRFLWNPPMWQVVVSDANVAEMKKFIDRHKLEVSYQTIEFLGQYEPEDFTEYVERYYDKSHQLPSKCLYTRNGRLILDFPYDEQLKNTMKGWTEEISGYRRWNHKDAPRKWSFKSVPAIADILIEFCTAHDFHVEESILKARESMQKLQMKLQTVSSASESSFELRPGFGLIPRPYQLAGIEFGSLAKRVYLGDEMGLGKTIQALAIAYHNEWFPMFVVCPAFVKYQWELEAKTCIPGCRVQVLGGTKIPPIPGMDVYIGNYANLAYYKYHWEEINPVFLVLDEGQKIKTRGTRSKKIKRVEHALELSQKVPYKAMLSGTMIENRPEEMWTSLQFLGYDDEFGGFMSFARRYCDAHKVQIGWDRKNNKPKMAWDFKGASNIKELNERIRGLFYVRRLKKDVLPELPPLQESIVPIELVNKKVYDDAEREFLLFLNKHYGSEKVEKAVRAEALTKMNCLRNLSVDGKIPEAVNWIRGFCESTTEQLIVFACHKEPVYEIAKLLESEIPIVSITGDHNVKWRNLAVTKFQEGKARVLVMSLEAGGVGLNLQAASSVLFIEYPWKPSLVSQGYSRSHRMGQTAESVNVYYLVSSSIDYKMVKMIMSKQVVVTGVLDGEDVEHSDMEDDIINLFKSDVKEESYQIHGG